LYSKLYFISSNKAIVIGAGVAGLATAARLAAKQFAVQVIEASTTYGGKLGTNTISGYTFDTGPSLFTQPQNLEELFTACGKELKDYLSYKALPISCKYFFENEHKISEIVAYTDSEKFAKELHLKLGENENALPEYLSKAKVLYNNIGTIFLNFSLHRVSTWLQSRILPAFKTVRLPYLFQNLNAWNKKHFTHKHTVQIFNRFATYNGSNPYSTPAMMSMIPHLELTDGTFHAEGGMRSIADALFNLCIDLGVQFSFNTKAESILHNNNVVYGVKAAGIDLLADIVVSNCDVFLTYKKLLNDEKLAKKILKQERSSSGVIFYWGIKKKFPELELHNIFFQENYKQEFEDIFKHKKIGQDAPTIYVNISSKEQPSHAPQDCENWFVLINAPSSTEIDWPNAVQQLRKIVLQRLSVFLEQDIEKLIECEDVLDPVLIEQKTSSYLGSLYGTASNNRFASFLRQANFSKKYQGLYFVGGSVHPGGGIPLCLKSALITADLIQHKYAI
jgi:phytoene desaturase